MSFLGLRHRPDHHRLFEIIKRRGAIHITVSLKLADQGIPLFRGAALFVTRHDGSLEEAGVVNLTLPVSVEDVLRRLFAEGERQKEAILHPEPLTAVGGIGLRCEDYGTHSLRRTKASIIYNNR